MRAKWWTLTLAVLAAAMLAGCGSSSKKAEKPTTPKSAQNRKIKAPATPQPASATKKPNAKTLAALPPAKKAGQGKSPQILGLEGKTVDEKLGIIAQDVGGFWQQAFSAAKVQFTAANVYIATGSVQIGCNPPGTINPTDGAYYCNADTTLILPVEFFTTIDQDPKLGDAGMATIVAVGYGLHVQHVAGMDQAGLPMATCLGGIWAASVYKRGLLDQSDFDKIGTLLQGWDQARGATASSLTDAFNTGYSNSDWSKCAALSQGAGG